MLDADDIDDDYFTPKPSTSLANIFGGPTNKETANESLKYTPPKKQVQQDANVVQNTEPKIEDSKASECLFACALSAYEWVNGSYLSRGKLGFAVLKIIKTNSHSIVLYNSNKTTLSNTLVTSKLNMTLKGNNYISYYDNLNKYWSIHGKEEEINKIINTLKTLGVDVKHTLNTDEYPPEPNKTENEKTNISNMSHEKESDTDSSVNRKTKASILNRMANMGHSVLPPSPLADQSSNSSDSNEIENQPPKLRPKPKAALKKIGIEKKAPDHDIADNTRMLLAKIEQPLSTMQPLNPALFAMVNGQLVPVSNMNVMPSYGQNNEMNLFMTEQRMNNNELRVNINRATDKVDQVLEKLKVLDQSDGDKSTNFQVEIMQKLLTEYEKKIKNYEQLLASKNVTYEPQSDKIDQVLELESYKTQILSLQSVIEDKDKEIINLNEKNKGQELLVKEIGNIKENLSIRTAELERVSQELEEIRKANSCQDFESKLKYVMNDVYSSVSLNFENDISYSGNNVKKILASIIKKATIQSLSEYNSEK